jgi:hypothetical protein
VSSAGAVGATSVAAASLSDWNVQLKSGGVVTAEEISKFVQDNLAAGNARAIYDRAKLEGVGMTALDSIMSWAPGTSAEWAAANGLPAFAQGGLAAPGWSMVGEEGPELVNFSQPGRVYTASETQGMFGGMDMSELLQEVRALREEVRAGNVSIASSSGKTARLLDRWDGDGMPAVRVL